MAGSKAWKGDLEPHNSQRDLIKVVAREVIIFLSQSKLATGVGGLERGDVMAVIKER